MFLLEVLQNIFPYTELLFNILQTKRCDISYCNVKVENVKGIIVSFSIDEKFDNFWQRSSASIGESRRKRTPFEDKQRRQFKLVFFDILGHMLEEVSTRFQFLAVPRFLELFDPEKPVCTKKNFQGLLVYLCWPLMVATLSIQN